MARQEIHHHPVAGGAIAFAWSHKPHPHPLVMLHGLGDSAILTFREAVARGPLATIPTLFIDLPGFGESRYTGHHPATITRYAADVAGLLIALRVEPTAVFGHSMGGNIAIHLALSYPQLVNRLIVAEPLLAAEQSVLASDIARFDEESFITRRFPMLVRATSLQSLRGDVAASAFLEPLRRANPVAMHRAAASLLTCAQPSLRAMLTGIELARTLIMGDRTSADTSMFDTSPIRIVRIANAGHFMLAEQENATSYAILDTMT